MRRTQRGVTEHVRTLPIGGQVLHLGCDVPPPPGRPLFPSDLDSFDLPAPADLAAQLDRTHGTGRGGAARRATGGRSATA